MVGIYTDISDHQGKCYLVSVDLIKYNVNLKTFLEINPLNCYGNLHTKATCLAPVGSKKWKKLKKWKISVKPVFDSTWISFNSQPNEAVPRLNSSINMF